MNQKVIDSKVTIIDESGIPHVMGKVNEPSKHVKYLLDYINLNCLDIKVGSLTDGNAGELLAYYIAKIGDITYFNEDGFGMFYFPDNLTDEQVETLDNIDLGYKKVGICYGLKLAGKNVMHFTIGMANDMTLKEAMEEYINKTIDKNYRR